MIGSISGKTAIKAVEMTVLQVSPKNSVGRQNLLSSIWSGHGPDPAIAMPNGDPPSLMLWGDEDESHEKRGIWRHG